MKKVTIFQATRVLDPRVLYDKLNYNLLLGSDRQ